MHAGGSLLLLLIVTLATASAGAPAGPAPTLRLASRFDVDSLDPALAFSETGWTLLLASCTSLMSVEARGRRGSQIEAAGAAAYPKVSADGRTYTFTIRRNLRFSNGTPVRAANYARAIGRLRDPRIRSPLSPFVTDVVSAHGAGRTLRIRLKAARGDFLSRATGPYFCPVPLNVPIDPAGVDLIAGSGPYRVTAREPNARIVLRRNPFWHGRRPQFASIVFTVTGTGGVAVRETEAGRFDYSFDNVPADLAPSLVRRYGVGRGRLHYKGQAATSYLAMNLERPLFRGNVSLRKAVNFAIDRPEIIRQLNPYSANRTDQIIPSEIPGFRNANLYPLKGANVAAARRLARGRTRGGRAVLYALANPVSRRQAEVIKFNLSRIGLDVDIREFARPILFARLKTPGESWDLAGPLFWFADNPDPYNFVGEFFAKPWTDPKSMNISRFADRGIMARLRRADRLRGAARYRALGQLEIEILRDHAPVAPIANNTGLAITSARLGCVRFNVQTGIDLARLCLPK